MKKDASYVERLFFIFNLSYFAGYEFLFQSVHNKSVHFFSFLQRHEKPLAQRFFVPNIPNTKAVPILGVPILQSKPQSYHKQCLRNKDVFAILRDNFENRRNAYLSSY
jgi:hypothetical protein